MSNGTLIRSKDDTHILFTGHIKTLQISIDYFELIRNPYKSPEKKSHPNYLVYIRNDEGEKVLAGAAWHKEFEKNGNIGEVVSLSFDDPSFKEPLRVTVFKGDDEYSWPITWKRERAKTN